MALKLTKRGATFYVRGTFLGRNIRRSLGTGDKRTAEILKARLEHDIEREVQLGRSASTTFAKAALTYMQAGGEARFIKPLLTYFGSDTLLKDIDQDAALKAARAVYPKAAPGTINRQVITPISAILKLAAKQKLCDRLELARLPEKGRRLRWLTPEEAESLFNAIEDPRFAALISFLIGTGARPGEAFALERKDLYLDDCEAWFPDTKTDTPRMVEFPPRTRHYLTAADLPESGPVFLTPRGEPYTPRSNRGGQIRKAFKGARDRAGLGEDVTPYILRHTWATWFHAATLDFGRLCDLGGWSNADTANRYRKMAPRSLAERLIDHGWHFAQNAPRDGRESRFTVIK